MNSIITKVFLLIFISIFTVLAVFSYKAVELQKQSILDNLKSQAKSIASSITYVNTDYMIIDDEIKLLEFSYNYIQTSKNLHSFSITRKNGNSLVITKSKWSVETTINKDYNFEEESKITYSKYAQKAAYFYRYPIILSGIKWGWIDLELSLDEYYSKLDTMYTQFFYLAITMVVVAFFASFFIAKMVSRPIVKLEAISENISNGDLSKRAEINSSDEIGRLTKSFNNMVDNLELSQYKLKKSHDELELRVYERTKELRALNDTLEDRVKEEISKQKEQEQILIQQSKLAAMGEMIGNIAHQWRQPLNALGLVMQNIQFSYQMDELDDEFMQRSIDKVNTLTKSMSKTIDDFRNFFKPTKEKLQFNLKDLVLKSSSLVESAFSHHEINIMHKDFVDIDVYGFDNEFSQTILNVLNNAKDAIVENKISDGIVSITLDQDEKFGRVIIHDNAGGVPEDIIEKIFNPYFTTKEEGKGTGIGLYMSKIIVEQNMDGKLEVKNEDDGATFTISIPLFKGEK
ncbi:HAMP domain-containing sensor histidine kinase [Arcobacter roscoffensis]|uniref:histidine kinase n=1 Tax=Arcobacter roscoffensis TaxID=2961520 RepID=A0ABY5E4K8_9BACT|nr:ATP-binding protein [Arcobacter roscoffensis]UTJ07094.1 ATP-binding protein [Arcobacter roscoffensis]